MIAEVAAGTDALEVCRETRRLSRLTLDAQDTTTHGAHNGRARRTVLQGQVSLRRLASRHHLRNVNPQGGVDFARFELHLIAVSHRRRIRAGALPPSPPETRSSFGLADFRSLILFVIRTWRTKVAKRSPGCRTRPATTVTAELHSPVSSLHPCRRGISSWRVLGHSCLALTHRWTGLTSTAGVQIAHICVL